MLQEQNISINFGQGIDTKTDEKMVINGKMLRLENAIFTDAKRIQKRAGYSALPVAIAGGGALSAPVFIKSYQEQLLCVDQGSLYAWSPTLLSWQLIGPYLSTAVTSGVISPSNGLVDASNTDVAVLGNYVLYAWDETSLGVTPLFGSNLSLLDTSNHTFLLSRTQTRTPIPGTNPGASRAVLLGGTTLGVTYNSEASNNAIALRTVNIAGTTASLNAEVIIAPSTDGFPLNYSLAGTATGGVIAYSATSGSSLIVSTFNTLGAITHTDTIAIGAASSLGAVFVNVDTATGNIWLYWYYMTAGNLHYKVYDPVLAVVLVDTVIGNTGGVPHQIMAHTGQIPLRQTVYVSGVLQPTALGPFQQIAQAEVNQVGLIRIHLRTFLVNCDLYSRAFTVGGASYFDVVYSSSVQNGVYTVISSLPDSDLATPTGQPLVIAKALSGKALGYLNRSFLSSAPLLSSTKVLISANLTSSLGPTPGNGSTPHDAGFISLDFADFETYQAIEVGGVCLFNGGLVWEYDGQSMTELGFSVFPESPSLSIGGSPGVIGAGVREYFVVYQWVDAQGGIHQSAPSIGQQITLTGSQFVEVIVTNTGLTQKGMRASGPVQIAVYRTLANGTVAHLVGVTPNFPLSATQTITDNLSDSTIANDTELYTTGGVIENIAPPPSLVMIPKSNRVWLVDSENPNTVWYSKSLGPNTGVSFSDLLTETIDSFGGKIVSLASLDDKIVFLEEECPYYQSGDGPNDLGTGSTLSFPQRVQSDVGCLTHKGTVVIATGILMKTLKGIYFLDRALGAHYIGAEVEQYNAQTVNSALLLADKNQVRFLTSSGLTLVYDYFFQQWSTFTNHQGVASSLWNSVYTYLRSDGLIYTENQSSYLDQATAYSVLAQMSWLKLSAVQGFQRIRRFLSLGKFKNNGSASHRVQVSAAYDYLPSFSTPIPYSFSSTPTVGPSVYQYRERLPIQKCEAISFLIEEVTTGAAQEYFDIVDMTLEVGVKKGAYKLPSGQSVG